MLPASRTPRRLASVMRPSAPTPIQHPHVAERREGRHDLLDRRRRRDRGGQVVVDEQRRRRDQRRHPPEVRLRHRVRTAARRVGDAHLAIAEGHDREQAGDRDRHRQRPLQRGEGGPAQDEGEDDLLGRVGRRADRVGAEDGQRLGLGQPLAELLLLVERTPEQDRPDPGDRPCPGRGRDAGRLLGGERAAARVPEVRRVRSIDPDASVARFAPLERTTTADHARPPIPIPAVIRRPPGAPPTGRGDRPHGSPPGPGQRRTRPGATSRGRARGRAPGRPPAGRRLAAVRRCPG